MAGEATLTNGFTNGLTNGHVVDGSRTGDFNTPYGFSKTKSGIKVIIVGAGFGGLCAAIECHRQGHEVQVFESFKETVSFQTLTFAH